MSASDPSSPDLSSFPHKENVSPYSELNYNKTLVQFEKDLEQVLMELKAIRKNQQVRYYATDTVVKK